MINLLENKGDITMNAIVTEKKGTGMGSEIMGHLKEYAKAKEKTLIVDDVKNPDFFRKFKWLDEVKYSDESQFLYLPENDMVKNMAQKSVPVPTEAKKLYQPLRDWESQKVREGSTPSAIFDKRYRCSIKQCA